MRSSVEASFSHSVPIGVTVRAQSCTGTENIQAINASVPVWCQAGCVCRGRASVEVPL